MSQYGDKDECKAWRLYVKENWTSPSPDNEVELPPRQQRLELLRKWKDAEQEFRDTYIARVMEEVLEENMESYHTDISPQDFRRNLNQYPCVRVHFDEQQTREWDILRLYLQLDENLSPLDPEELPPLIDIRDNFQLESYTKRYILEDANFEMMGCSNDGHKILFYHIIMVVDEQSFLDGTLLHVDFNSSGDPAMSFRYPAINSYLAWKWHHESALRLSIINVKFHNEYHESGNGHVPNGTSLPIMDLNRPIVDVLIEEMRSRGVSVDDSDYRQLAIAAVSTVNERLLEAEE